MTDTIKSLGAVGAALIIVAGGLLVIYLMTNDGKITGGEALAVLGPLIGGAAAWLFGRDTQAGAARAAERAVQLGANAATPPASATFTESQ